MTETIKEILKLDLKDDIKNVIDLEDQSENEIQDEISSYIVTNGIGEHLSKFSNEFTSNIKETGVWISGFYGSGKSYFGKMLGYLIGNPSINGTSARDRFIPRLSGINNQSLIENSLRKLDSIKSRVIFLDIAKQNTSHGLSFTLFTNFLKNLGFKDNVVGYVEYDLFVQGKFSELEKKCKEIFHKEWKEVKESNRDAAKALSRIHIEGMDYTEAEYQNMLDLYSASMNNFSPNKLKEELKKYLDKTKDEVLVFIFDETSEAITQGKFKIDELQGMSEALSSISQRVWTIAIAQEKLDEVIINSNISKKDLNKVTERFKTKLHLESTEVDIIIRNRLLQKKEGSYNSLVEFYKKNDGQVAEATNLSSSFPTKTENAEEFAIYYPFHRYHFDLLQKFLFSSNALTASQIAARGMIITTFDVLRKHLRDETLFTFSTANNLCMEGQPQPTADLINKYDNANKTLSDKNLGIEGDKLLRTVHFLSEAEIVSPTLENITKSYIKSIKDYYDYKPKIQKALDFLIDVKILLVANNIYKITSDQERKLLDEMNDYQVQPYLKKAELLKYIIKGALFRNVSGINEDTVPYNFKILSDAGDDIIGAKDDSLKLTVYSLYNIDKDLEDFIENIKMETQYAKDIITLIPDNTDFEKIDKLIVEINKYNFIEKEHGNSSDQNIRQIIRNFSSMKDEKEKDIITLINNGYSTGSLIYMFDQKLLNSDNFKGTINEVQKKLIRNIYTKRLSKQLSDSIASSLLSEKSNEKLHTLTSGDDFKFFDSNGNFIGEHLKVVEELTNDINKKFTDGKALEDKFSGAPWAYSYGTIISTLAALFRAGRLVVRFSQTDDCFDYKNKEVQEVFRTSKKFQSASFKSISKTLSATQKAQLAQALMDMDYEKHTSRKIDYNTNEFELAGAIGILAEHFVGSIGTLSNTINDFQKLFSNTFKQKEILQKYISKVTEANYIEKTDAFLNSSEVFKNAIKSIVKTEKFHKQNFAKVLNYKAFADAVKRELSKAGKENEIINEKYNSFNTLYAQDLETNFLELQQGAQAIKDEYFSLMTNAAEKMSEKYKKLKMEIEKAKNELSTFPYELNETSLRKIDTLLDYCNQRIVNQISLDFEVECKNCKYALSEMFSFAELAGQKVNELVLLKGNFIKEKSLPYKIDNSSSTPVEPKKVKLIIENKIMTTSEYRNILAQQLQTIAGMENEEKIELTVEGN